MLVIDNLEVKYGDHVALSILSPISFEEGDRIGIIGSNGAGKSTLVKSILGINRFNGNIKTNLKPEEISAHLQFNNYADTMKVKYVIEAIIGGKINKNKKLLELIEFFNFDECLNKKFPQLSGGQKQRMTIILVLIQDTPLVFFDEVTSGLDFETRQQLMDKISSWYSEKNSTICIVSHYYEELEQLANKILILEKGQIVDFGIKEELFKKYCGNSVITIDRSDLNEMIIEGFSKIKSPNHLISISCRDKEEELEVVSALILNNINFKRSNNDIEVMFINAISSFYEKMGGENIEKQVI